MKIITENDDWQLVQDADGDFIIKHKKCKRKYSVFEYCTRCPGLGSKYYVMPNDMVKKRAFLNQMNNL